LETFDSGFTGFCAVLFQMERQNGPVVLIFLDSLMTTTPLNRQADSQQLQQRSLQLRMEIKELTVGAYALAEELADCSSSAREILAGKGASSAVKALAAHMEQWADGQLHPSLLQSRVEKGIFDKTTAAVDNLRQLGLESLAQRVEGLVEAFQKGEVRTKYFACEGRRRRLYAARNRWTLAVLLHNNPSLRKYRKHRIWQGPNKTEERLIKQFEEEDKLKAEAKGGMCSGKSEDEEDQSLDSHLDSKPVGLYDDATVVDLQPQRHRAELLDMNSRVCPVCPADADPTLRWRDEGEKGRSCLL